MGSWPCPPWLHRLQAASCPKSRPRASWARPGKRPADFDHCFQCKIHELHCHGITNANWQLGCAHIDDMHPTKGEREEGGGGGGGAQVAHITPSLDTKQFMQALPDPLRVHSNQHHCHKASTPASICAGFLDFRSTFCDGESAISCGMFSRSGNTSALGHSDKWLPARRYIQGQDAVTDWVALQVAFGFSTQHSWSICDGPHRRPHHAPVLPHFRHRGRDTVRTQPPGLLPIWI